MNINQEIQKWLESRDIVQAAIMHQQICFVAAKSVQIPSNLRPATEDDFKKIGQVVWYPDDGRSHWEIVDYISYGDQFKAFTGHDGLRYELDGAFIEIPCEENVS